MKKKTVFITLAIIIAIIAAIVIIATISNNNATNNQDVVVDGTNDNTIDNGIVDNENNTDNNNSNNDVNENDKNNSEESDSDTENDSNNNNDSSVIEKPNTWTPTSENLVGFGYYPIKNDVVPFNDGDIISDTSLISYMYFSDLALGTYGEPLSYVCGDINVFDFDQELTLWAEGSIISVDKTDDGHANFELQFEWEHVFKSTPYCIVYVYEINNEIIVKIDTTIYTESREVIVYEIMIDGVKCTVTYMIDVFN